MIATVFGADIIMQLCNSKRSVAIIYSFLTLHVI